MQFHSLHKRIDTLLVAAQLQHPTEQRLADAFQFDLFTQDEQKRLRSVIAQLETKDMYRSWGMCMNDFTIVERDQLESWLKLYHAIECGDADLSARVRRYLALDQTGKEHIYRAFCAINEYSIPDAAHILDAPRVEWYGSTCYMWRKGLQDAKGWLESHKRRTGYFRRWEIFDMWLWLEWTHTYI